MIGSNDTLLSGGLCSNINYLHSKSEALAEDFESFLLRGLWQVIYITTKSEWQWWHSWKYVKNTTTDQKVAKQGKILKFHKVEVISFLQSFVFLCYVNKVEVISFLQLCDHSKDWRNEITSTLLTNLIKWKGNYFRNFSLVFFNILSGMIMTSWYYLERR